MITMFKKDDKVSITVNDGIINTVVVNTDKKQEDIWQVKKLKN